MSLNVQSVIQAISRATEMDPRDKAKANRRPLVTLSRNHGSGGDEIAQALAERLGVNVYGKDLLQAVAKRAEANQKLVETLHDKLSSSSDSWLYSMVFGKNLMRDDFTRSLVTVIRGIYPVGGVIVGRGAHVILAGRKVLRVRIIGSTEACAKRIAMAQRIELSEAKKQVRETNQTHARFVANIFRSRINDPSQYDLVISTDNFVDYSQVVDLLVQVMHMMDFDVPE